MVHGSAGPLQSRTVGGPQSGSDLGLPVVAFPSRATLTCCPTSTPARSGLLPRALRGAPALPVRRLLELPRAQSPCACTRCSLASWCSQRITSAGVPPPSSLLRTPASVLPPPRASGAPATPGLGRGRSAPAGRRTLPPFSRRRCPSGLGPLPRWLLRGLDPFRPARQRPSPRSDRVGAPPCPCSDCSPAPFSRL
jgi:hypothetical protein